MLTMVAGALASVGGSMLPSMSKTYGQTSVRHNNYKTGGKPFTRGKRDKSLKVRANRRKAKSRKRLA